MALPDDNPDAPRSVNRSTRAPSPPSPRLLRLEGVVDGILRWGTLLALIAGPLLIGGVHVPTALGLSASGVLLGALALWRHRDVALQPHWILSSLLLWVIVTALQLLPLPISLIESLNTATAEHYHRVFHLLDQPPEAVPLSLSVNRTAVALWHALGFLGFFLVASLHMRHREAFTWFVPRLLAVGVAFGLAALVQTLLFEDTILGLYTPEHLPSGPFITTLINPNNAGGLFGASAAIALGVALSERRLRAPFTLLYVLLSVCALLMLSRGAILAWLGSHLILLLVLRSDRWGRRSILPVMLGALLGVALMVFAGYELLADTFQEISDVISREPLDLSEAVIDSRTLLAAEDPSWLDEAAQRDGKFFIYRDLGALFDDFSVTGFGRGAFVEVYPRYTSLRVQRTYHSVENEYLELTLEYGLPFALLFFLFLGVGLLRVMTRRDWRGADRAIIAGLLMAVALLAVQNLFDFSMRIPGIAFFMATLLGLAVGRDQRYREVHEARRTEIQQRSTLRRTIRVLSALLLGVALLIALLHIGAARDGLSGQDIDALKDHITRVTDAEDTTPSSRREMLVEQAREALVDRPVDGFLRFVVALGIFQTGEGGAEAAESWLREAIIYHPNDHRIRFTLARSLFAQGRHESAAEGLRAAAYLERGPSRDVMRYAALRLPDLEHLQRVTAEPSEPIDRELLGVFLVEGRRFDVALDLGRHLDAQDPEEPQGLSLQIQVHLALGFPEAAIRPAERMVERFPDLAGSYGRLASVYARTGEPARADAILLEGLERHPRSHGLLYQRASYLLSYGRRFIEEEKAWREALDAAMEALRPAALSRKSLRPGFYILRGRYYTRFENHRHAQRAYEKALHARPDHLTALQGHFSSSLALGDIDRAEVDLEALGERLTPERVKALRERLELRREQLDERRKALRDRATQP